MLSFSMKTAALLVLLQSVSVCALLHDITLEGGIDVHWDYSDGKHGPAHWHDLNESWLICKTGNQQSPIAISEVTDSEVAKVDLSEDPEGFPATILNNGHAVNVGVQTFGAYGHMTIDGLTHYNLNQFHYHMPSEHRIMNQSFPLELHMVYNRTNASLVGSEIAREIAVISFLFLEGEESTFFAQFDDILPSYKTPNIEKCIGNIRIPEMGKSYGQYLGSLTTPPCTQNVFWTINMWDFPTVSKLQLEKLRAALPSDNNRPTFPSTGRDFHMRP